MTRPDIDIDRLLIATAEELFARHCTIDVRRAVATGGWAPELWRVAAAAELPWLGVAEASGGGGGTAAQWASVIRVCARHAAPIPLLETSLAAWLLAAAARAVPPVSLTIAEADVDDSGVAVATAVPYARHAAAVVVALELDGQVRVGSVARAALEIEPNENPGAEPRDRVRFGLADAGELVPISASIVAGLRNRRALGRALQIAGALEAIERLTIRHVRDRTQFGVALARLPVVRERLALLTEERAVTGAVCAAAVETLERPEAELAVAAAKVRAGEAAGRGARIAHQLHGAIGMTDEHVLHHFTRRLWAWRDDDGDERTWAVTLGRAFAAAGGPQLWPTLTRIGQEEER